MEGSGATTGSGEIDGDWLGVPVCEPESVCEIEGEAVLEIDGTCVEVKLMDPV